MSEDLSILIGDLLRRRGISLRRLASELGVSPSTLSRWSYGKQVPSPSSCRKLAECLSLAPERVLALAGHLTLLQQVNAHGWPEFREYARQKYPDELDEDMIAMVEDLINRRRKRREETHRAEEGSAHPN